MTLKRAARIFGVLLATGVPVSSQGASLDFEGAKWIWFSREPMPISQSFPAGVHAFRMRLEVPNEAQIKSAELVLTADNLYSVYLNGNLAGESEADQNFWNRPKRFEVTGMLRGGGNTVAIEAINTVPGPAGLLVKLGLEFADGRKVFLASDEHWKCSDTEATNWFAPDFDDTRWQAAHVVGAYGMAPWGRLAMPAVADKAGADLTSRADSSCQLSLARSGDLRGGRLQLVSALLSNRDKLRQLECDHLQSARFPRLSRT
jgi:hypothetical protein